MKTLIIAVLALLAAAPLCAQDNPDAKAAKKSAKVAKADKKGKKGAKKDFKVECPALKTAADSVAYTFGIVQSQGFKEYVVGQLRVDTAYLDKFVEGALERINVKTDDPAINAKAQGYNLGGQIEQMAANFSKDYYSADPDKSIDKSIVAAALLGTLLAEPAVKPEEAMNNLRNIMAARQAENSERLWGENRRAGEQFLAENKKKDGVITLPSGLQYKVLTEGTGAVPTSTSRVKVNYEGHLIDGTEFDSSYKRNEPTTFQANQVIKGWTEALCKMPVGSKWELYIPQELAYGERETGKIKPYSALIFTVELLEIEAPKK